MVRSVILSYDNIEELFGVGSEVNLIHIGPPECRLWKKSKILLFPWNPL